MTQPASKRLLTEATAAATYVVKDAQVYAAKDHGIMMDGSTFDRAALTGLIATVNAAGGGTILLPAGTLLTDTTGIIAKSNVTLQGSGWGTVISLGAVIIGTPGVIQIGAISNFTIRDLKIEGNRATYAGDTCCGIWAPAPGGFSNILIENVWVDGFDYIGIGLLGSSTRATVSSRVRIRNVKTSNTGGHGILAQWAVDDAIIENCTVSSYGQTRTNCPGITNGRFAYDAKVLNCTVDGTGSLGTSAHCISMDTPYGRAHVRGNTVTKATGYGIEMGYSTGLSCVSNTVTSCHVGINLTSDTASETRNYLGICALNTVRDCTTDGITNFFQGATAAMATPPWQIRRAATSHGVGTLVESGGRTYKCTTAGTTSATTPVNWGTTITGVTITDGTAVWTDQGPINSNLIITQNNVRNCGGSGISLSYSAVFKIAGNIVTECVQSGIYVDSTCNMYSVERNDLWGNNTTQNSSHGNLRIILTDAGNRSVWIDNPVAAWSSLSQSDNLYVTDSSANRMDGLFLANSATPSVAIGNIFRTNSVAATTISQFLDGNTALQAGREITVLVKDANTTFMASTSGANYLVLAGGVNYSPPAGTALKFIYENDGLWHEVARYAGAA